MNFNKFVELSRRMIDRPDSKYKHFSFIVCGQTIFSIGVNNTTKTHPLAQKYGHRFASTHSEINALGRFPYAIRLLRNYDMVNVRLNKKGIVRLAKPCIHCQQLLMAFHIQNIYYSTNSGDFEILKNKVDAWT